MGWKAAQEILGAGGRLAKFPDGHAEVIGPTIIEKRWMGIYGSVEERTGGCCEGYLTQRSVELLEEHGKDSRRVPTEPEERKP